MDFGITQKKQQALVVRMASVGLEEGDLDEKFIRSSGPGGQHINKTATCAYLKHIPTGIEVKSQTARSQGLNRYYARKRLCELLEEKFLGKESLDSIANEKAKKQKQRRKRRTRKKLTKKST